MSHHKEILLIYLTLKKTYLILPGVPNILSTQRVSL